MTTLAPRVVSAISGGAHQPWHYARTETEWRQLIEELLGGQQGHVLFYAWDRPAGVEADQYPRHQLKIVYTDGVGALTLRTVTPTRAPLVPGWPKLIKPQSTRPRSSTTRGTPTASSSPPPPCFPPINFTNSPRNTPPPANDRSAPPGRLSAGSNSPAARLSSAGKKPTHSPYGKCGGGRLSDVLALLVHAARIVGDELTPFLPETAKRVAAQLGSGGDQLDQPQPLFPD